MSGFARRFLPNMETPHRGGSKAMYWDDAVIFGLVTVGLMIAFMVGWVGFIIRDHRRKR